MMDVKINDMQVFKSWLEEECVYLQGLSTKPPIETLEMEYYTMLIKLQDSQ